MFNFDDKRWVAMVQLGGFTKGKGHRVMIVVEGESFMRPTGDAPEGGTTEPWYWGDRENEPKSFKLATETCQSYNSKRGISPEEAKKIVEDSMIASIRERGLGKRRTKKTS